jgi:hypothetical protein
VLVLPRVREKRDHDWRESIEEPPPGLGILSSLEIHLERRGLSHHLDARWPDGLEVARHSGVTFAVKLERNRIDGVEGVDSHREEIDSHIRHRVAQQFHKTLCRVDAL